MRGRSSGQFNTGRWTDAEHQCFLRGLEEHGSGNWESIAMIVRTRSPQQVEAHARQHFAESAGEQLEATPPGSAPGGGAVGDGFRDWTGVL